MICSWMKKSIGGRGLDQFGCKKGIKTPSFFHFKASGRKMKNWISGIADENNIWSEKAEDIENVLRILS